MLCNMLEFIFPLLPRDAPVKVVGTVKTINSIDCVCLSCQEVEKHGLSQVAFYRKVMALGQRRDLETVERINGRVAVLSCTF